MTLYELPASYDPDDNRSVDIPRALIPLVAGRLSALEAPSAWGEADQVTGPQAAILLQERLVPVAVAEDMPPIAPVNRWEMTPAGTLYQDAAGTIPAVSGDPVRVIGDLGSQGVPLLAPSDAARGIARDDGIQFSLGHYYQADLIRWENTTTYIVLEPASHDRYDFLGDRNSDESGGMSAIVGIDYNGYSIAVIGSERTAVFVPDSTAPVVVCIRCDATTLMICVGDAQSTAISLDGYIPSSRPLEIGRSLVDSRLYEGKMTSVLRYDSAHDSAQRSIMRAWLESGM